MALFQSSCVAFLPVREESIFANLHDWESILKAVSQI